MLIFASHLKLRLKSKRNPQLLRRDCSRFPTNTEQAAAEGIPLHWFSADGDVPLTPLSILKTRKSKHPPFLPALCATLCVQQRAWKGSLEIITSRDTRSSAVIPEPCFQLGELPLHENPKCLLFQPGQNS